MSANNETEGGAGTNNTQEQRETDRNSNPPATSANT